MATSLLRSEALTLIRAKVRDSSATNPGLADATYNLLIEEARQFYASVFPEQAHKRLGFTTTISGGNLVSITITTGNIEPRNINMTVLETAAGPYRPLTPIMDLATILKKQDEDQVLAEPRESYAERSALSDTIFNVYLYPVPDNVYTISVFGTFEPALLTGNSDPLLFGFHGSRVIANLAAIEACNMLGRPVEFTQALMAKLPEKLQTRMAEAVSYTHLTLPTNREV